MSRSILRSTSLAVLFVLLGAATSTTLTHRSTLNATAVSQLAVTNGPGGGGDPFPPCPDCVVPALH